MQDGLRRVVWKILHEGVRFTEQGSQADPKARKQRARIFAWALRKFGCDVAITPINPATNEMGMQMGLGFTLPELHPIAPTESSDKCFGIWRERGVEPPTPWFFR